MGVGRANQSVVHVYVCVCTSLGSGGVDTFCFGSRSARERRTRSIDLECIWPDRCSRGATPPTHNVDRTIDRNHSPWPIPFNPVHCATNEKGRRESTQPNKRSLRSMMHTRPQGPSGRADERAEQQSRPIQKRAKRFFGCRLPAFESWEHWRGRQQGPAGRIWDVRSFGEVSEVKKQALKA